MNYTCQKGITTNVWQYSSRRKRMQNQKKINMMWIGFLTIRMYLIYARIILNCTGIKKLNYTS